MQRGWIERLSILWIAAAESSCRGVVVSGAEVVEGEVGVVLFAAIDLRHT